MKSYHEYIIKTDNNEYNIKEEGNHIYIDGLKCNPSLLDFLLDLDSSEILELKEVEEEKKTKLNVKELRKTKNTVTMSTEDSLKDVTPMYDLTDAFYDFQIEEGTIATPYESYKEKIDNNDDKER